MAGTATDEDQLQRHSGISMRDYFAAKAMQGMLTANLGKEGWATVYGVASDAYKLADAMIAERSK